jgi:hypothetical protein
VDGYNAVTTSLPNRPSESEAAWQRHYEESARRREAALGARRRRAPVMYRQKQLRVAIAAALLCLAIGLLAAFLPT